MDDARYRKAELGWAKVVLCPQHSLGICLCQKHIDELERTVSGVGRLMD